MLSNNENLPYKIGKYRILSILGEGGMGIVYKAIDPNIEQLVAIKVIRPEILEQDRSNTMLKRFRNEVLACRRLKHENIVSTYDYQEMNSVCFIVMELIEGKLLSEYLKQDISFEQTKIVDIIIQLLSALEYAHNKGVIHRDIKPDNISINENGSIQVMDFGIAKLDTSNVTLVGSFLGSPGYMSPEQCQEHDVDNRSDLFSVGVLLYQLLTGKKPFAADTMAVVLHKTIKEDPEKPSIVNNKISPEFDKIISKALAKQPKKRFQSAAEFKSRLLKVELEITSQPAKSGNLLHLKPIMLGLILTGLSTLGGYYYFYYHSGKNPHSVNPHPIAKINQAKEAYTLRLKDIQLNELINSYQCNTLTINSNNNGTLLIRGSVLAKDLAAIYKQLAMLLAQTLYENEITALDRPFCEVVNFITPFYQNNIQKGRLIKISPYQHTNQYVEGEIIQFELSSPDYPVYLYADYFASDGAMLHLYPTSNKELEPIITQKQFILGNGSLKFEVTPPYGTDLITLIASPIPLFKTIQDDSSAVGDYLNNLSKELATIKSDLVIADYIFVSTGPKK